MNAQPCALLQLETAVVAGDLLRAGLPQTQDGRVDPLTMAPLQWIVVKKAAQMLQGAFAAVLKQMQTWGACCPADCCLDLRHLTCSTSLNSV